MNLRKRVDKLEAEIRNVEEPIEPIEIKIIVRGACPGDWIIKNIFTGEEGFVRDIGNGYDPEVSLNPAWKKAWREAWGEALENISDTELRQLSDYFEGLKNEATNEKKTAG